jgi:hypothetical protein
MADLFSVTAPLAIRFRDSGEKQVLIERLPYNGGLIFLPPFWIDHELEHSLRYVPGPIEGEGPWKVGAAVVTVLGCHGTDAELAGVFSDWQVRRMELGDAYPEQDAIHKQMKVHAAQIADLDSGDPRFRRRR